MPKVRLALAQTNPIVGDLDHNRQQIVDAVVKARDEGAKLVVFAEMSLTGYPIEDLATRKSFLLACKTALLALQNEFAKPEFSGMAVVIGLPTFAENPNGWAIANNSAVVIVGGEVIATYKKHHLPNYSVFDEYRNFVAEDVSANFEFAGLNFCLLICEDIWQQGGPVARIKSSNTDVALVLNGSPFEVDKDDKRLALVRSLATTQGCAVAYVNLVGGQDDLVFDGDSLFVAADGAVVSRSSQFKSDLMLIDIESKFAGEAITEHQNHKQDDLWQVWNALTTGLRDYVEKNGFRSVVLGLSGGIDSAVCAALAVDALGSSRVLGVSMPSKYSSDHSKSDAFDSAKRLGIEIQTQAIESMVVPFESQLKIDGLAAENLQARMRGAILMSISNAQGHLVLTTGNKTEIAVGYSTIYGDSVGGFAPIKDIEKSLVWKLAEWRNTQALAAGQIEPIPRNSITKPPSAELRPDQVDQDTLPEYDVLDAILDLYVEKRMGRQEIVNTGFDEHLVSRIINLVDQSEWKRRQGAIGPKITGMAFGRDRRLPITNKFRK
jgi:NAD+ synthase (glutamine-hydrolysing)